MHLKTNSYLMHSLLIQVLFTSRAHPVTTYSDRVLESAPVPRSWTHWVLVTCDSAGDRIHFFNYMLLYNSYHLEVIHLTLQLNQVFLKFTVYCTLPPFACNNDRINIRHLSHLIIIYITVYNRKITALYVWIHCVNLCMYGFCVWILFQSMYGFIHHLMCNTRVCVACVFACEVVY
jgi:hypothetical protein